MEHAMLPAVRAASQIASDPLEVMRTDVVRANVTMPAPIRPPADDAALPLSGGRLSALSLSAQLQLGQSFSIVADTIGKLLDLPRGANETLVDYSQRLSQAIQALPPVERAGVERLLNQIVKGVPLRLLAELLKNPSGPDAARLVALLEGSAPANLDLAAKAAVGSYRQNAATSLLAQPNLSTTAAQSPASPGSPPPAPPPQQVTTVTPDRPAAPALAAAGGPAPASTAGHELRQSPAPGGSAFGTSYVSPDQNPAEAPSLVSAGHPTSVGEGKGATAQQLGSTRATCALPAFPAKTEPGAQAPPRPAAQSQQALFEPTELLPAPAEKSAATTTAPLRSGFAVPGGSVDAQVQDKIRIYDAFALVRLLQETVLQEQTQPGALPLHRPAEGVAALVDWLARLFGETDDADHSPLADSLAHPAGGSPLAEEALPHPTSTEADTRRNVSMPAHAPVAEDRGLEAQRPTAPQSASTVATAKPADLAEGSLAAAVLPAITPPRDGIGWLQVPFPPAEEEPRQEERKARAISAITDDEDDTPSGEHGFGQDHQQEDQTENNSGADRESGSDPDDEQGQAADFYWRLAGWA
jgi:hypothetical protein